MNLDSLNIGLGRSLVFDPLFWSSAVRGNSDNSVFVVKSAQDLRRRRFLFVVQLLHLNLGLHVLSDSVNQRRTTELPANLVIDEY